uniref:hypothetical protein n=1 Tax=Lachnospira sp. TaxID=2049031 RepID=UPI003FF01A52
MKVIVNAKVKADEKLKAYVKLKADVNLNVNGRLVIVSTCYFVIIDINYQCIYKKSIEWRLM